MASVEPKRAGPMPTGIVIANMIVTSDDCAFWFDPVP